jgi:hypothetical protein
MTIPSGPASLADIQAEFGGSGPISLDEYYQGGITGYVVNHTPSGSIPTSGAISIGNFLGVAKAFVFNDTVSVNTPDYNLSTRAALAGWDGTSKLIASITINSGIYVYATSTATPGFTIGVLPATSTVAITNNGIIAGQGGLGGVGGSINAATLTNGSVGSAGGTAASFSWPVSMTNIGTIGGGGGGGGGGGAIRNEATPDFYGASGGGGGAGRLRHANDGGAAAGTSTGNTTDGVASSGGNGSLTAAGAGGARFVITSVIGGGVGGDGGGFGAPGSPGTLGDLSFSIASSTPGAGGAAGPAVVGGVNVTWFAFGSRFGSIDNPGVNAVPGGVVNFSATAEHLSLTPGTYGASVTFQSNGTISVTPSGGGSATSGNWYAPTTPGTGSAFWIRSTVTSTFGSAILGGISPGVWTNIGTGATFSYSSADETYVDLTVDISASSGGAVIGTGTVRFEVGYVV